MIIIQESEKNQQTTREQVSSARCNEPCRDGITLELFHTCWVTLDEDVNVFEMEAKDSLL